MSLLCLSALCHPVWAQSQRTVSELIQSIKAQKEKALEPQLAPSPAALAPSRLAKAASSPPQPSRAAQPTPPGPGNAPMVKPEPWPQVWSLTGINGTHSAELLIDRRVYPIDGGELPQEVAGWLVMSISERDVCLSRHGNHRCLRAPGASNPQGAASLVTVPAPAEGSANSPAGAKQ